MSRRTASCTVVVVAMLLAGGCRAIVGIDDLNLASDAGADGGRDALADVSSDATDASVETGTDSSVTQVVCNRAPGCPDCCRQSPVLQQGMGRLDQLAAQQGCICSSGQCATECAQTICKTPPGQPNSPGCGGCIDQRYRAQPRTPACGNAHDACMNDPQCKLALDCILSCP